MSMHRYFPTFFYNPLIAMYDDDDAQKPPDFLIIPIY